MNPSTVLTEIAAMSVDDRIRLVEAIWDSIAQERLPELTEAQKQELARRLADHAANPGDVIPWDEVKARALARARR